MWKLEENQNPGGFDHMRPGSLRSMLLFLVKMN